VFTRPWTIRVAQRRMPDDEFWEVACHEGNFDPDVVSGQISNASTDFNQCPKHKPQCRAEGCGRVPFLQQHDGFVLDSDALAPEAPPDPLRPDLIANRTD